MTPKELQNALSAICEQIASGNYEQAKAIFDLSPCEPDDDPQNLLVEALGMMLLRVEAREFELERLLGEITNARVSLKQNHAQLTQEIRRLRKRLKAQSSRARPVAQSPVMQILMHQAEQIAKNDSAVLICGDTGTGKNLFARHIHTLSNRREFPLVSANIAGIPANRVEIELFGHEGSAVKDVAPKKGIFEKAAGGTVLLNEVRALPQECQKKLLVFLDTGTIRHFHGKGTLHSDVRIIATSRKDIEQAVKAGYFMPELYARLKEVRLTIPPLRERCEDIHVLAKYFLAQQTVQIPHAASTLEEQTVNILMNHDWPGNVRELESAVRNAALIAEDDCVRPENLREVMGATLTQSPRPVLPSSRVGGTMMKPFESSEFHSASGAFVQEEPLTLLEMEAAHIKKVLALTSGNKSKAAHILGISREGLRTKLIRAGIGAGGNAEADAN